MGLQYLQKILSLPNQTNKHDMQDFGIHQSLLQVGSVSVPQAETGPYRRIFTFKKGVRFIGSSRTLPAYPAMPFSICAMLIH